MINKLHNNFFESDEVFPTKNICLIWLNKKISYPLDPADFNTENT